MFLYQYLSTITKVFFDKTDFNTKLHFYNTSLERKTIRIFRSFQRRYAII